MIRWFAQHPVASNLLLFSILALALVYTPKLQRTTLPDIPDYQVSINIIWDNASTDEIVDAICKPVEQKLEGIDNMRSFTCRAYESTASFMVTMDWNGNYNDFYDDVIAAVSAAKLPDDVRSPIINKVSGDLERFVASVSISGFDDPHSLKAYTEQIEEDLKRKTNITETSISGFSDLKYYIDLDPDKLRALNLSTQDIATMLSSQSIDNSLGTIEGMSFKYRLKIENRKTSITALENTLLTSFSDGGILTLGDIAHIYLDFEDAFPNVFFNNKPSASIAVFRTDSQDMLLLSQELYDYVDSLQENLPDGVNAVIIMDLSKLTKERLSMVTYNGIMGIILAFFILWLFFNLRYSLWIAAGLFLSFAGGLVLMHFAAMSINLMTLAGLLVVIGILMDDAVVVAENIHSHYALGKSKIDAAVDGTIEVAPGVFSSFLTTIMIAFTVSFLQGEAGVILVAVPISIILVLTVSLIEAFLILPTHLAHSLQENTLQQSKIRKIFYEKFNHIRDHMVYPIAKKLIQLRYYSLLILFVIFFSGPLILSVGIVKQESFPTIESNTVDARILHAAGTKRSTTIHSANQLLVSLEEAIASYKQQYPSAPPLLERYIVHLGYNEDSDDVGDHQATIYVDLNPNRKINSEQFSALWAEKTKPIADLASLNIMPNTLNLGGDSLFIRVISDDEEALIRASQMLESELQDIKGVSGIISDLRTGAPEWKFELTPLALNLGLTAGDIAHQIRSNVFGNITDELQVGGDSIEISLRYGGDNVRVLNLLEDIRIKTPSEQVVPLQSLVLFTRDFSPTKISRYNGSRVNRIKGSINKEIILDTEVKKILQNQIYPEILKQEPNVQFKAGGQAEDTSVALDSLIKGAFLGFFGIYVILVLQFRSWLQPISVMLIMPLGLTGSILGHLLLGFNFSMPSVLGIILMLGVAVNDSILLVIFIRRKLAQGKDLKEAAAAASKERFRAVFLTSVTTVAGVLPLLLETNIQAQIIQPIAISIAFGLMMTTTIVLFFIPTIYVIIEESTMMIRKKLWQYRQIVIKYFQRSFIKK